MHELMHYPNDPTTTWESVMIRTLRVMGLVPPQYVITSYRFCQFPLFPLPHYYCHDPDASGHETCITTVCPLILTLFVCSPCTAFVRTLPPVALSMITHCLTCFDCVYQCLDLCSDLCLDLVYKPCVHIVRSQTWLRL